MTEHTFDLGDAARDTVTGFEGTVTARAVYLTGVPRIGVSGIDTTGRPVEVWEDEARFAPIDNGGDR